MPGSGPQVPGSSAREPAVLDQSPVGATIEPDQGQGCGPIKLTNAALKTRRRAERAGWPESLALRVHRALSWLNPKLITTDVVVPTGSLRCQRLATVGTHHGTLDGLQLAVFGYRRSPPELTGLHHDKQFRLFTESCG